MVPETNTTAPIDIKPTGTTVSETVADTTNDPIISPFTLPIKLEQIVSNEPSGTTAENPSEYFYDFQAENFHAEQVSYLLLLNDHMYTFV